VQAIPNPRFHVQLDLGDFAIALREGWME
jgi:hypothetical protein